MEILSGGIATILIIISAIVHTFVIWKVNSNIKKFTRERMYLTIIFISDFFWIISIYFQINLVQSNFPVVNLDIFALVSSVGHLTSTITLILLSLFISQLVNLHLSKFRIIFFGSISSIIIVSSLLKMIFTFPANLLLQSILTYSIYLTQILLLIATVWFLVSDLKLIGRKRLLPVQNNQFYYLILTVLFTFLLLPVMILGTSQGPNYAVMLFPVNLLSVISLTMAYQTNPHISFISPQSTYMLLLLDKNGNLHYNHQFQQLSTNHDVSLVASYVGAFQEFMSEYYQNLMIPRRINLNSNRILFRWSQDYEMIVALFCSVETLKLTHTLEQTMLELDQEFNSDTGWNITNSDWGKIDQIVRDQFEYIIR